MTKVSCTVHHQESLLFIDIQEVENFNPVNHIEIFLKDKPEFVKYQILSKHDNHFKILLYRDDKEPNKDNTSGMLIMWC